MTFPLSLLFILSIQLNNIISLNVKPPIIPNNLNTNNNNLKTTTPIFLQERISSSNNIETPPIVCSTICEPLEVNTNNDINDETHFGKHLLKKKPGVCFLDGGSG